MILDILFGIFGLTVLVGIAFLFSNNKKKINWRLVATGVGLQLFFAILVILTPWGEKIFKVMSSVFVTIIDFTNEGSKFVFGMLADPSKTEGFLFAFQALPTIIFFSSLMSVLYHLGIMQKVVEGMAWIMTKAMNISGSESLSVAANVFIGQTEAPLVVRPYISKMTHSELLTLMVGGMATIAGGVLAIYVSLLGGTDEVLKLFYAKHLLSASVMAAPATIVIAKILIPETEESLTKGTSRVEIEKTSSNVIEAAANGAADGLKLALNVAGMLLAFIALIAMLDYPLNKIGDLTGINGKLTGYKITAQSLEDIKSKEIPPDVLEELKSLQNQEFSETGKLVDALNATIGNEQTEKYKPLLLKHTAIPLSFSLLLGLLLAPLAWIIGVPWQDVVTVGGLLGEKVIINEFFAYVHFGQISEVLSDKARLISTYALCGFANFSSIAIQIGGIGPIAPNRRSDLARYGLRAVLGGTLATMMTATIAGVLNSL